MTWRDAPSGAATLPHADRLHDDVELHPLALGCLVCHDQRLCGGMRIAAGSLWCLDRCCGGLANCDTVCPAKPRHYVDRIREINGFDLARIPSIVGQPFPALSLITPVLYGGGQRHLYCGPTVSLSMWKLIDRHQQCVRYQSREALAAAFSFAKEATIILTGVDEDGPLERYWNLEKSGRRRIIRDLVALGIHGATSPNFSMFTSRPRYDDLYSMKRIAITWYEMMDEGLATALHVNARADSDWLRWTDFIVARPEIDSIAYEFKTPGRKEWHAARLIRLAKDVGRPLRLVVRGGRRFLSSFAKEFAGVHLLDTSSYVKTMKRQRALLDDRRSLSWVAVQTGPEEFLDDLFLHNVVEVTSALDQITNSGVEELSSDMTGNGRHEARPRRFLDQSITGQGRLFTFDKLSMIPTHEPKLSTQAC